MNTLKYLGAMVVGAALCAAGTEVLLRMLPVNSGVQMQASDEAMPIARYRPGEPYTYSRGWAMENPKHATTNALGYPNAADTFAPGGVAVIGDSYIESFMLDYQQTMQGRLAHAMPGKVTAFGASGNGLADSLRVVETWGPRLHPGWFVVLIEANDLISLLDHPDAGHNGFQLDGDRVSIAQVPYRESPMKAWVLRSATLKYLYYNLKIAPWASSLPAKLRPWAATAPVQAAAPGRKQAVLRWYFEQMHARAAAGGYRLLYLVDSNRAALYGRKPGAGEAWDAAERAWLITEAARHGDAVVDLEPVFADYWRRQHVRLDFNPSDMHWNAAAHALAARQVIERISSSDVRSDLARR